MEAEQIFKKIMEYLPIWPGTDDSDYPIDFRQIATAQMGQQRWEAAEEELKQSVALFDPQIEKELKSDDKFTELTGNLIGSQATSLSYLSVVSEALAAQATSPLPDAVDRPATSALLADAQLQFWSAS